MEDYTSAERFSSHIVKISSGHMVGKSLLYKAACLKVNQCRYSGDSGDQQ